MGVVFCGGPAPGKFELSWTMSASGENSQMLHHLERKRMAMSVVSLGDYSHRNATIGSTLDALRAGRYAANAAIAAKSKAAAANVAKSDGSIPKSTLRKYRVAASARGTPSGTPPVTSRALSLNTSR